MTTNLTPLGDRVIVRPTDNEQTSAFGIILPDTAKEKPQQGEIIAVGPGKRADDGSRQALDVEVGQSVIYAKYAGTEFKLDRDDKVLILKESDLLAIVG